MFLAFCFIKACGVQWKKPILLTFLTLQSLVSDGKKGEICLKSFCSFISIFAKYHSLSLRNKTDFPEMSTKVVQSFINVQWTFCNTYIVFKHHQIVIHNRMTFTKFLRVVQQAVTFVSSLSLFTPSCYLARWREFIESHKNDTNKFSI